MGENWGEEERNGSSAPRFLRSMKMSSEGSRSSGDVAECQEAHKCLSSFPKQSDGRFTRHTPVGLRGLLEDIIKG